MERAAQARSEADAPPRALERPPAEDARVLVAYWGDIRIELSSHPRRLYWVIHSLETPHTVEAGWSPRAQRGVGELVCDRDETVVLAADPAGVAQDDPRIAHVRCERRRFTTHVWLVRHDDGRVLSLSISDELPWMAELMASTLGSLAALPQPAAPRHVDYLGHRWPLPVGYVVVTGPELDPPSLEVQKIVPLGAPPSPRVVIGTRQVWADTDSPGRRLPGTTFREVATRGDDAEAWQTSVAGWAWRGQLQVLITGSPAERRHLRSMLVDARPDGETVPYDGAALDPEAQARGRAVASVARLVGLTLGLSLLLVRRRSAMPLAAPP